MVSAPIWTGKAVFVFCNTIWKLKEFTLPLFDKSSVKRMSYLKKLLKNWFQETYFQWEWISRFSTLWILKLIVFLQFEKSGKNVKHFFKFFPDHGKIICDERGYNTTVWKFHDFTTTQILCEINMISSKIAISTI